MKGMRYIVYAHTETLLVCTLSRLPALIETRLCPPRRLLGWWSIDFDDVRRALTVVGLRVGIGSCGSVLVGVATTGSCLVVAFTFAAGHCKRYSEGMLEAGERTMA